MTAQRLRDLVPGGGDQAYPEVDRRREISDLADTGEEFEIRGWTRRSGQHGPYAVILAADAQGEFVAVTGARALYEDLEAVEKTGVMPVLATVARRSSKAGQIYYVFGDPDDTPSASGGGDEIPF